jgi:hypothetical protein
MPRVIVGPPVDQPSNDGIGRVQPGPGHLQPGQDIRSGSGHYSAVLAAGSLVAALCL